MPSRGCAMSSPEFRVGQKVTYKPYENAMELVVLEIQYGAPFVEDDDRVFYRLAPLGAGRPTSVTTGRCIVESKLFEVF